jgi:hypothetical protein
MRRRKPARRPVARALAGAALLGLAQAALPAPAGAHGLGGAGALPIPRYLFAWGASIVLVVSFVALARLWPRPRLERAAERPLGRIAGWVDPVCGALGTAVFAVVIYAGLAGVQDDADRNLMPVFIYILFWVGIPIAGALFGDVFRAFNPWRAVARAAAAAARAAGRHPAPLRAYPARVGRWPAAITILGFAWLELVAPAHVRQNPSTLAVLALAYAALQLLAMRLYGIEIWERYGDGFSVYFGLFARLSPLRWSGRRLRIRSPLQGVTSIDLAPGTVALLTVMIGTTSFDGFSRTPIWTKSLPPWERSLASLRLGPQAAEALINTLGLLVAILVIAWLYRLGITGMRALGERPAPEYLARRFVHSLVPIALAYVIAHYFSLLVFQGQDLVYLASDPLGTGANLLGTAGYRPVSVIGSLGIWYVQLAALIVGHVCGLVLAHDRALVYYRRVEDAVRSQYWMLAVMVSYTCLGLWLLSEAA